MASVSTGHPRQGTAYRSAQLMSAHADCLHRTVKLELDDGRATTLEEAEALAASHVLQVVLGPNTRRSQTRQAMLLTAVNAGARAFLGGVRVVGDLDWSITTPWTEGCRADEAVGHYGGTPTSSLAAEYPTLVIGESSDQIAGSVVVHLTWQGWAGGVVDDANERLAETDEFALAGVLAAAIGVAEAFQAARGAPVAGRRCVGISLWRPDLDWRESGADGGPLLYLPSRLWILGLGHLGQAYLWALGFLPYPDRNDVEVTLQDFDRVVEANRATGMLVQADTGMGYYKTRIAAEALEALGLRTRIIERRFDEHTRPGADDPIWALGAFDDPRPRRFLDVFTRAVDAGLGSGADDYLAIRIHAFPAAGRATDVFGERDGGLVGSPRLRYSDLERRMIEEGASEVEARCGLVELAGIAIGAAFVGVVAATLVVADVLRALIEDRTVAVLSLSLASPEHVDIAVVAAGPTSNPGFQACSVDADLQ